MGRTETPYRDAAPSFTFHGLDVVHQALSQKEGGNHVLGEQLYFRVKDSVVPVEQAVGKQQTGGMASDGSTKFWELFGGSLVGGVDRGGLIRKCAYRNHLELPVFKSVKAMEALRVGKNFIDVGEFQCVVFGPRASQSFLGHLANLSGSRHRSEGCCLLLASRQSTDLAVQLGTDSSLSFGYSWRTCLTPFCWTCSYLGFPLSVWDLFCLLCISWSSCPSLFQGKLPRMGNFRGMSL